MFRFLLFGPRLGDDKSTISWVTDLMWNGIKMLSQQIDGFEKLPADMVQISSHAFRRHIPKLKILIVGGERS